MLDLTLIQAAEGKCTVKVQDITGSSTSLVIITFY